MSKRHCCLTDSLERWVWLVGVASHHSFSLQELEDEFLQDRLPSLVERVTVSTPLAREVRGQIIPPPRRPLVTMTTWFRPCSV